MRRLAGDLNTATTYPMRSIDVIRRRGAAIRRTDCAVRELWGPHLRSLRATANATLFPTLPDVLRVLEDRSHVSVVEPNEGCFPTGLQCLSVICQTRLPA